MATLGFLGLRGTGDWVTDQRPKNFREGLLLLFPNGDVPITAINSKGKSRQVDDPEFTYFSKTLPDMGGTLSGSGVFDSDQLDSAFGAGAGAVGLTVFASVTVAIQDQIRTGHTVILVETANDANFAFGEVTGLSTTAGGTSVAVKLLIASAANILANADFIDVVGNANAEGAFIPDALTFDPEKFTNFTQIFRDPLDLTRTARKTRLRTGDAYQEAKREALEQHGLALEMAAIAGEKSNVVGSNGKQKRTTQGAISFVKEHASDNVSDYASGTTLSWKDGGEDFLDEQFELVFRFGRSVKMAFIGSGALLGIQQIVKNSGQFQLTSETLAYGIQVMKWVTPFGTILLMRHPLFTYRTYRTNSMLILEPENITFSFIDDTMFKGDDGEKKAGTIGFDGTKEEFLTEGGWEWHFPTTMMYLTSIGKDGTL